MARDSRRARAARRWFRRLIGPLREIAWDYGYALCVHGTIRRDIDLVAVPWITWAAPAEALIEAFAAEVERYIDPRVVALDRAHREYDLKHGRATRAHGRRTWALHLTYDFGAGPYLDVSVMPRAA